jgi:hypothetical protein
MPAVGHAELLQDVFHIPLNGFLGQEDPRRDLAVGGAAKTGPGWLKASEQPYLTYPASLSFVTQNQWRGEASAAGRSPWIRC